MAGVITGRIPHPPGAFKDGRCYLTLPRSVRNTSGLVIRPATAAAVEGAAIVGRVVARWATHAALGELVAAAWGTGRLVVRPATAAAVERAAIVGRMIAGRATHAALGEGLATGALVAVGGPGAVVCAGSSLAGRATLSADGPGDAFALGIAGTPLAVVAASLVATSAALLHGARVAGSLVDAALPTTPLATVVARTCLRPTRPAGLALGLAGGADSFSGAHGPLAPLAVSGTVPGLGAA